MAWTTPATWTTGEVVTAAKLNTHVRDNLNAIGQHTRIVKAADESVTSSTALQDDNELLFSVNASEIWIVDLVVWFTASTTGDIKVTLAATATSTGGWTGTGTNVGDTAYQGIQQTFGVGNGFGTLGELVRISSGLTVGGTGGTLKLQWAQNTSDGTATVVKAGSWLSAHRVS